MSDNIRVAIRVRPLIDRERENPTYWVVTEKNQIEQREKGGHPFVFDHVFDQDVTTDEVYREIADPIVDGAMKGFHGTIFAYGQTSSGKTYTMMGDQDCPGVIPSAIDQIFNSIENILDREFLVRVSYLEIYNENVFDLLGNCKKHLDIREDRAGSVFVSELKEELVAERLQVFKIMQRGEANRRFGSTNMNERSSRSHTIFRVIIESRLRRDDSHEAVMVSHLNLVDLAGSEKAKQTGATGQRLQEGGFINKSLFHLGNVISQLSEGHHMYVSYRDAKLTRILQNALGGNSNTVIIGNVTPASHEETLSTLRFASSAKHIKNKPVLNEVLSDEAMLKRYKLEIQKLKKQLEQTKSNQIHEKNEELQQKLAEKERNAAEQEARILRLTQFICKSSKIDDEGNGFKAKRKRRETWCPGKARPSIAPNLLSKSGKLSGSNVKSPFSRHGDLSSVLSAEDTFSKKIQSLDADMEEEGFDNSPLPEVLPSPFGQLKTPVADRRSWFVTERESHPAIKFDLSVDDEDIGSKCKDAESQTESDGLQSDFQEAVTLSEGLVDHNDRLKQEKQALEEMLTKLNHKYEQLSQDYIRKEAEFHELEEFTRLEAELKNNSMVEKEVKMKEIEEMKQHLKNSVSPEALEHFEEMYEATIQSHVAEALEKERCKYQNQVSQNLQEEMSAEERFKEQILAIRDQAMLKLEEEKEKIRMQQLDNERHLQAEHKAELQKLQLVHAEALKRQEAENVAAIHRLKTQYTSKIDIKTGGLMSRSLPSAPCDNNLDIQELQRKYQEELAGMEQLLTSQFQITLDHVREEHREELKTLEEKYAQMLGQGGSESVEDIMKQHEETLGLIQQDHLNFTVEMEDKYTAELELLQEQCNSLVTDRDQLVKTINELKEKVHILENDKKKDRNLSIERQQQGEEFFALQEQTWKEKRAMLEAQLEEQRLEIEKLRANVRDSEATDSDTEEKDSTSQKTLDLEASFQEQITALQQEHAALEETKRQLEAQHELEVAALKQEHEAVLGKCTNQLQSQYEEQLANLKQELAENSEQLETDQKKEIASLMEKQEAALMECRKEIEASYELKVQDLKKQHKESLEQQLNEVKASYEELIVRMSEDLESTQTTQVMDLQTRQDELLAEACLEKEIALQSQNEELTAKFKQELEELRSELNQKHQRELEGLEEKKVELIGKFEEEMKELKVKLNEKHHTQLEGLEEKEKQLTQEQMQQEQGQEQKQDQELQEKLAQLEKEYEETKAQLHKVQKELENLQICYTEASDAKAELTQKLEAVQRTVADKQDTTNLCSKNESTAELEEENTKLKLQIEQLKKQVTEVEEKLAAQLELSEEGYEEQLMALRDQAMGMLEQEKNNINAKYQAEQEMLQAEHEESVQKLKMEHAEMLEQQALEHMEVIDTLKREHEEILCTLREEHRNVGHNDKETEGQTSQTELEEQLSKLAEEMEKLNVNHQIEVEELKKSHSEEIGGLNSEIELVGSNNQTEMEILREEIKKLTNVHQVEMEEAEQKHLEEMNDLRDKFEKLNEEEHDAAKELINSHQAEIEEMEKKHQEELSEMQQDFNKQHDMILEELKQEHKVALQAVEEKYEELLKSNTEENIQALLEQHKNEIAALKSQQESQLEELEKKYKTEMDLVKQKQESLQTQKDEFYPTIEKLQLEVQRLEEEKEQLEQERQQDLDDIEVAREKYDELLALKEESWRVERQKLEDQLEEMIKEREALNEHTSQACLLLDMENQHQEALEKQSREMKDQLKKLQEEHRIALEDVKAQYEQQHEEELNLQDTLLQLQKAQEQLGQLKEVKAQTLRRHDETRVELEQTQQTLITVEQENLDLMSTMQESEMNSQRLQTQLTKLQQERAELQEEKKSLEAQSKKLEAETARRIKAFNEEIDRLENCCEEADAELEEAKKKIAQLEKGSGTSAHAVKLEEEKNLLEAQIRKMKTQIQAADQRIATLEEETRSLEAHAKKVEAETERRVGIYNEEINRLENCCEESDAELEEAKKRIAKLEKSGEMSVSLVKLEEEKKSLETQLKKSQTQTQEKLNTFMQEIDRLVKCCDDADSELDDAKEKYAKLEKEHAVLLSQQSTAPTKEDTKEMEKLKKELASAKLKINALETELVRATDPHRRKIRELEQEVEYQKEKLQQYKNQIRQLRNNQVEDSMVAYVEKEKQGARPVGSSGGGSGIVNSVAIFTLEAEKESLEREVKKLKLHVQQLEKTVSTKSLFETDLRNKNVDLEEKVKRLKAMLAKKEKEMASERPPLQETVNSPSLAGSGAGVPQIGARPRPMNLEPIPFSGQAGKSWFSLDLNNSKKAETSQDAPGECNQQ